MGDTVKHNETSVEKGGWKKEWIKRWELISVCFVPQFKELNVKVLKMFSKGQEYVHMCLAAS